jgi:hypothetical protein
MRHLQNPILLTDEERYAEHQRENEKGAVVFNENRPGTNRDKDDRIDFIPY